MSVESRGDALLYAGDGWPCGKLDGKGLFDRLGELEKRGIFELIGGESMELTLFGADCVRTPLWGGLVSRSGLSPLACSDGRSRFGDLAVSTWGHPCIAGRVSRDVFAALGTVSLLTPEGIPSGPIFRSGEEPLDDRDLLDTVWLISNPVIWPSVAARVGRRLAGASSYSFLRASGVMSW